MTQPETTIDTDARFAVLGDLCIAGEQVEAAYTNTDKNLWEPLRELIGNHAPVIANLECPITSHGVARPRKYANLRARPAMARIIAGLNVAVLGNNHITDFGDAGVRDTLTILADLDSLRVGYGENLDDAARPVFLNIDGRRVGLISFCCPTTNGENLATHLSPGVAPIGIRLIRDAIAHAKDRCDALLVYFHWGAEHVHDPVPDQIRVGRFAIECGADAVVGCHSHTVQSYECYQGRWIFYGLGNFLFGDVEVQSLLPDGTLKVAVHRQQAENRESLAIEFSVVDKRCGARLRLVRVSYLGIAPDLIPRPIPKERLTFDIDAANGRLSRYCLRNKRALAGRGEPEYRCSIRNGILAFFYAKGPLAPLTPFEWLRDLLYRLPGLLRSRLVSVASVSPRRLYWRIARVFSRT